MKINVVMMGVLLAMAAGCGGDDKVSTDSNGNGVNKAEASCCLGGSFYDCDGDGDAAEACFNNGEPGSCQRDSGKDEECSTGDD